MTAQVLHPYRRTSYFSTVNGNALQKSLILAFETKTAPMGKH